MCVKVIANGRSLSRPRWTNAPQSKSSSKIVGSFQQPLTEKTDMALLRSLQVPQYVDLPRDNPEIRRRSLGGDKNEHSRVQASAQWPS